jgi:hypothetical protein
VKASRLRCDGDGRVLQRLVRSADQKREARALMQKKLDFFGEMMERAGCSLRM